jgi:Icc-related predicted phosphoesterase
MSAGPPLRVAAAADLHCREDSGDALRPLVARMAATADVLCLCGDLTHYGRVSEAEVLAKILKEEAPRKPMVGVLGNHDYECGQVDEVIAILSEAGLTILSGDEVLIGGVGFAGAKGFGGGFGPHQLEPWGEPGIKHFVNEAVGEALLLETALARIERRQKIVLLHYAPILETVSGEPLEIMPFLGSSRLEEPINRYGATAVFHGHAHRGRREGRTSSGIPVYNVAVPLLRTGTSIEHAFRVVDVCPEIDLPAELVA